MRTINLFQKLHNDIHLMAPESQRVEDKFMIIEDYNIIQDHHKPFFPGVIIGEEWLEGNSSVIIDNVQYNYSEGDLLVILPDRVTQYCEEESKCKIRGIVMVTEFLEQTFSSDLGGHLFSSYYSEPILHLNEREKKSMDIFFSLLKDITSAHLQG